MLALTVASTLGHGGSSFSFGIGLGTLYGGETFRIPGLLLDSESAFFGLPRPRWTSHVSISRRMNMRKWIR